MKIAFFIGGMYQGGAERQLVYLCNGLSSRGHEVTLLTLRAGDAYGGLLSSSAQREVLTYSSSLTLLPALVGYLRSQRPDVIVNFLFHAALLGRIAARITGVPCITSHRNVSYGRPWRDLLIRLTGGLDYVATTNVAAASTTLKPYFRRVVTHTIGNIYNSPFVGKNSDSQIKVPLRDASSGFRWCFIGRLEKQKNLPALLLAFKILMNDTKQEIFLDIAGSGSEKETLLSLIAELELEDDVVLHGQLKSTAPLLSAADALILPSSWEGMPNVLMEAMAVGLPCVATPVGAVPEMFQNGRGILAEGTDPDAIAKAMQDAMSLSAADRQEMVLRAKAFIEKECSPEAVIDRWECMLARAVKDNE